MESDGVAFELWVRRALEAITLYETLVTYDDALVASLAIVQIDAFVIVNRGHLRRFVTVKKIGDATKL